MFILCGHKLRQSARQELEERASAAKADTDRVRRKLTRKEAELSALKARYPGQVPLSALSMQTLYFYSRDHSCVWGLYGRNMYFC